MSFRAATADERRKWIPASILAERARATPDKEFLQFEDQPALSYAQTDRSVTALANGLAATLGIKREQRVMLMAENSLEVVQLFFALNRLGAVVVFVNGSLKGAFLDHVIRDSSAEVMLVDHEFAAVLDEWAADHISANKPSLLHTLVFIPAPHSTGAPSVAHPQFRRVVAFSALWGAATPINAELRHDENSAILYTSGTTGPAKGVLMPNAHLMLFGVSSAHNLRMTAADKYMIVMPLVHVNALGMQLLSSMYVGGSCVIFRKFSATHWLRDVRAHSITITNTLGVISQFILNQAPTPHDKDHKLTRIGGAPIFHDLVKQFRERFNVAMIGLYGMTEINIPLYSPFPNADPRKWDSCGVVQSEYFDLAIVDPDTDERVPPNTTGEIVVRPKVPFCFSAGYLNQPLKTIEGNRNFWFHTGDAAKMDEDGFVYFVDRIKDCIRVKVPAMCL
eukprot:TRINITY_DN2616_c0_g1_i4.p1 TRINITY_DN2616_c0_g1~~TRINITY_DN2616_c0_g1_i4.p1  ORF type:complete len:458 (-),score=126.93 TRINITY_DN2616_c0_g1_i4:74-1423(-)